MIGGPVMTGGPVVCRLSGWPQPEAAVADLRERFPGVPVWFGLHTRRFWALVGQADASRLVETITPDEMEAAITGPQVWPWP